MLQEAMPAAFIEVITGPDPRTNGRPSARRIQLDKLLTEIGRRDETDIQFYDLSAPCTVSRTHCKIEYDAASRQFTLTDEGSTFGTLVNMQRLAPNYPTRLHDGDVIEIGKASEYGVLVTFKCPALRPSTDTLSAAALSSQQTLPPPMPPQAQSPSAAKRRVTRPRRVPPRRSDDVIVDNDAEPAYDEFSTQAVRFAALTALVNPTPSPEPSSESPDVQVAPPSSPANFTVDVGDVSLPLTVKLDGLFDDAAPSHHGSIRGPARPNDPQPQRSVEQTRSPLLPRDSATDDPRVESLRSRLGNLPTPKLDQGEGYVYFIFSRADLERVRLLGDYLAHFELPTFLGEDVVPGKPMWGHIVAGQILAARAVVVVCSRNAASSPWIEAEIDRAQTMGKTVIPVIIDGDDSNAIPEILNGQVIIDLRGDHIDVGIDVLTHLLKTYLRFDLYIIHTGNEPAALTTVRDYLKNEANLWVDERTSTDPEAWKAKIDASRCVILLISQASRHSAAAQAQLSYAVERQKVIIAIQTEAGIGTDELGTLQIASVAQHISLHINLSAGADQDALTQLKQSVEQAIATTLNEWA